MSVHVYRPNLPRAGDIADPAVAAGPFQDAVRMGRATTHYQWGADAFPDRTTFAPAHVARLIGPKRVAASLRGERESYVLIPDDAGADAQLWKIPHNAGFSVVGGQNDPMELTFQTTVAAQAWIFCSYQYVRRAENGHKDGGTGTWTEWADLFMTAGRDVRAQMRLAVDGIQLAGSGPFALPVDGRNRGTGMSGKAAAVATQALVELAPGEHTVQMLAAQAPVWADTSDEGAASATGEQAVYNLIAMDHGVVIGSRELAVILLPQCAVMR